MSSQFFVPISSNDPKKRKHQAETTSGGSWSVNNMPNDLISFHENLAELRSYDTFLLQLALFWLLMLT